MSDTSRASLSLGLTDIPLILAAPGPVFRRVAERARYAWPLASLVLITTLVGWIAIRTGLMDRQIDQQTAAALADLERDQTDVVSRIELSDRMATVRKSAEFNKLIARTSAVVAGPATLVASVALIAAVLFAIVALTGQKPDYPLLLAVCTYASVPVVLEESLRVVMMLWYRTIDVDTSLGILVRGVGQANAAQTVLSAIDPFRVWYWVLVALGVRATEQLSRRAAVLTCACFWLIASAVRMVPVPAAWSVG